MGKPLLALAFFVLLAGLGYAAGTYEESVYSAIGIAAAIGLTIAALGYMVGQFIGSPQIQGWAKNEVYENIYSLFLIANVAVLAVAAQIFFVNMSAPPPASDSLPLTEQSKSLIGLAEARVNYALEGADVSDLFTTNTTKLKETKWTGIRQLFFSTYGFEVFLGSLSNLAQFELQGLAVGNSSTGGSGSGSPTAGTPSISANLLPGIGQLVDFMETINELILVTMFMLIAHKAVLLFVSSAAPKLLILGVIFRALPITRRLGSTLIALFITMGFVYPAFIYFAFSDGFYVKMVNEFSGAYVTPSWLSGIPGTTLASIVIYAPKDIVTVPAGSGEGVFNLSFTGSLAPLMNYTVKDEGGNVLCSSSPGSEINPGDIVNCTIHTTKIGNIMDTRLKNPEYADPSKQFFNITTSFIADAEYTPCGNDYISPGDLCSYTLSFPVWVVRECESTECKQQQLIYESEWDQVRDSYVASQTTAEIDDIYSAGLASDAASTVAKGYMSWAMKKGITKLSKGAVQKGIGAAAGKLIGGPVSLVLALPMKSDISTGLFDEIACDAYSGAMARKYFDPDYPQPTASPAGWDASRMFMNIFMGVYEFTASTSNELKESTIKMYGESDYTSCSSSLGAMNYIFGNMAEWANLSKSPREYNFTILLSRVIFVLMITLFSIVITVTFFRSIAESIGGDSSLMGLGKLIE